MQNPPTPAGNDEAPIPVETASMMTNGPRMKAEAPIPTETVSMSNGPNMRAEAPIPTGAVSMSNEPHLSGGTVKVRRKAAKRTLPFELAAEELLVSQDDDNPARKKPRLEEPLPISTDKAARKTNSPDISVDLTPPAAKNDDANADPVTDTQPNDGAPRAPRCLWTLEGDAKLTHAVANTSKKMWCKEYNTDWSAISELILGRTRKQCRNRWNDALDPSNNRASGRTGKWTEDEDSELKDAVQMHGDKDWVTISSLVHGRTRSQCMIRWKHALDPNTGRAHGRTGKWFKRRRQQAEGCGTNSRCQGLGCNFRAGSGSNEKSVFDKIASCLESHHRPGEWTYGWMDRRQRWQAKGCGTNARWQGLGRNFLLWFRVERVSNVGADGMLPWIPASP